MRYFPKILSSVAWSTMAGFAASSKDAINRRDDFSWLRLRTNSHIEQRHPILEGLQDEANQDQTKSKHTHPPLGHVICAPFNSGRACVQDHSDDSNRESRLQANTESVPTLMRH